MVNWQDSGLSITPMLEKTEEIEVLYWACDKCAGNIKDFKRGGAQHLKKAIQYFQIVPDQPRKHWSSVTVP